MIVFSNKISVPVKNFYIILKFENWPQLSIGKRALELVMSQIFEIKNNPKQLSSGGFRHKNFEQKILQTKRKSINPPASKNGSSKM